MLRGKPRLPNLPEGEGIKMYYAGRIKDNLINKAISAILAFAMAFSFIFPRDAFAGRSDAGGGEIPEYSWKDFGTTVGIAAASYVGGTLVSGALNSIATGVGWNTGPGLYQSFSNMGNMSNIAAGYNTYMAASNVQRAAGMAGAYYDWDSSTTYVVGSIATAVTAGLLNPSIATGESVGTSTSYATMSGTGLQMATTATASTGTMIGQMLRGAGIAAFSSGTSSAVIWAMERDRIDDGENPTWQAQAAGFLAGWGAGSLARTATSPKINDETINVIEQGDKIQEAKALESDASKLERAGQTEEAQKLRDQALKLRGEYAMEIQKTPQYKDAAEPLKGEAETNQKLAEEARIQSAKDAHEAKIAQDSGDMQTAYEKATSAKEYAAKAQAYEAKTYAAESRLKALTTEGMGPLEYEVFQKPDGTWGKGKVIDRSLYADNERYKLRPIGENRFDLIDTDAGAGAVLRNLYKSVVVEPFTPQNLTALASRVTALRITSEVMERNEDKPWLEDLVNTLAQSVSAPIYGAVVNTLGIDGTRYLSLNRYDRIGADLRYDIAIRTAGRDQKAVEPIDNREAKQAKDTYEAKRVEIITDKANELESLKESYGPEEGWTKEQKDKFKAKEQEIIADRTKAFDKALNTFNLVISSKSIDNLGKPADKIVLYNLSDPRNELGLTDEEFTKMSSQPEFREKTEEAMLKSSAKPLTLVDEEQIRATATKTGAERKFNIFGQILAQESQRVGKGMEMDKVSLSQALDRAKISRGSLLLGSLTSGVMSGIFEGGISGGTQAIFDKWADRKDKDGNYYVDPLRKFAVGYGVDMISAGLRGVVDWAFWKYNTEDWNWAKRYELVLPERYAERQYNSDGSVNPKYNFIADKLSYANYDNEMLKFSEFVDAYGLSKDVGLIYHQERKKWDFAANDGKGGWVQDPRWVAGIMFSEEEPGLLKSIARSIDQALVASFYKAFTFGRPMIKLKGSTTFGIEPDQVSVSAFNDYVSQLRIIGASGPGGITDAFWYQLNKGNMDTAGENIAGTLVRIPYVPSAFNMRPERFVDIGVYRVVRAPMTRYDFKGRAGLDATAKLGEYEAGLSATRGTGGELEFSKYSGEGAASLAPGAEMGGHDKATEVISKLDLEAKAPSFEIGGAKVELKAGLAWEGRQVDYVQDWYVPGSMPAGVMDFTVQSLSFGGPGFTRTTFWAPFPNPLYGTRPQTGEGEYLRRKGLAK